MQSWMTGLVKFKLLFDFHLWFYHPAYWVLIFCNREGDFARKVNDQQFTFILNWIIFIWGMAIFY